MMRAAPVMLVGVLVAGAAVAAGFGSLEFAAGQQPWELVEPEPPPPPPPEPILPPEWAEPAATEPSWLAQVLNWLGLLVVATLAGLLLWALVRWLRRTARLRPDWLRLRRLRAATSTTALPAPAQAADEQLVAAVDEAVTEAAGADDPRRAVIACWVRLADAAAEVGVARHPSDTASDLVFRLLRGCRVSEPVLGSFAEVYRRARFASHPVDEQSREAATSALHRLRVELRAGPAPEPGSEPGSESGPQAKAAAVAAASSAGAPAGARPGGAR